MKKILLTALSILIVIGVPTNVWADEIEEVVVVGATVVETDSDPTQEVSLIEIVLPARPDNPGGYGGAALYNERGTQTSHSTIFVNGIPANDSGSGWYDFAHDLATGSETVKVVTAPNGVAYGSGSLGGAVFITDSFETSTTVRWGDEHDFLNVQYGKEDLGFSITSFDVNNGSVKTDNEEDDFYSNTSVKTMFDAGILDVVMSYTDYEYDYDNCYPEYTTLRIFVPSNDCTQQGERGTVSARNDNVTFGYTFNNTNYYTNGTQTTVNEASRVYVDARDSKHFTGATITYGVTLDQAEYNDKEQNNSSVYLLTNTGAFDIGLRVSSDATVLRAGFEKNGFFGNLGTSYSNPTLYQQYGDGWVKPNSGLLPEEAIGGELGYNGISVFSYNFSEGISYENQQYVNTGSYSTKGVRVMETVALPYGGMNIMIGYTDSDQPRVPKWKSAIDAFFTVGSYKYTFTHSTMRDRMPSVYDKSLDNIQSLDFNVSKEFGKFNIAIHVQDIFDDEYEVLPGFGAGGRSFLLTVVYK
jgi:outer membrane cobalamin receptor